MRNHLALAILLPLCCFATACSSFVQQPTATLKAAQIANVTSQGFTVNFDVDVSNPNPVSIALLSAGYKLGLGGVQVVDNQIQPGGALPANGTMSLTVPVSLTYENLLSAEQAIASGGGEVPYDLNGVFTFDAGKLIPSAKVRAPLKHSGTLSLRRILSDPSILVRNPTVRRLAEKAMTDRIHLDR